MSIDRGDRVILMMLRSLCGCGGARSKVGDNTATTQQGDEVVVGGGSGGVGGGGGGGVSKATSGDMRKVVMICTQNVIRRGLIGRIIGKMEDKSIATVAMKLIRPTPQLIAKSNLVKAERRKACEEAWLIFVWRGARNVQDRIVEATRSLKYQFSLQKNDIYFTESASAAVEEERIWFSMDVEVAQTSQNGEVQKPSDEEDAATVPMTADQTDPIEPTPTMPATTTIPSNKAEVPVAETLISSEGPLVSVDSSKLVSPVTATAGGENHETSEVISNTAESLKPDDVAKPKIEGEAEVEEAEKEEAKKDDVK